MSNALPHYILSPLCIGPDGGSWYQANGGSVVVRYQPWASREARWYAGWTGFAGQTYSRQESDRKRLQVACPFTFTLKTKKETK